MDEDPVDEVEARRQRAEARRQRAVLVRTRLGAEVELDPIEGAAAISLVTQLTRQAWTLAGLPFPDYPREAIPCRFVRWPPPAE